MNMPEFDIEIALNGLFKLLKLDKRWVPPQEIAAKQKNQRTVTKTTEKEKEQAKKSAASTKNKKRIDEIEQKINRLEQKKESIETIMATEDFYKKSKEENAKVLDGYHALCNELNALFAEWEKVS